MKKALKVLKEIGIAIALLLLFGGVAAFAFWTKFPIAVEIPEPEVYVTINKADFSVATGGIENAQNETVIYQSTTIDLEKYDEELRYTTGRTEPLGVAGSAIADIPTDIIQKNTETEE